MAKKANPELIMWVSNFTARESSQNAIILRANSIYKSVQMFSQKISSKDPESLEKLHEILNSVKKNKDDADWIDMQLGRIRESFEFKETTEILNDSVGVKTMIAQLKNIVLEIRKIDGLAFSGHNNILWLIGSKK